MDQITLILIIGGFALWMVLQVWRVISKHRSRHSVGRVSSPKKSTGTSSQPGKPVQAESAMRDRERRHVGSHRKLWTAGKPGLGIVDQKPTKVSKPAISSEDIHAKDDPEDPEFQSIVYTPGNLADLIKEKD